MSLWNFPAVSIKLVAVCSILVVVSSSLAIIGRRELLAPSRHSWMEVEISATNVLLVRCVNRIEMEHMESSRVLGIFCGSAMCSSAVARLSYVIDCHVGIVMKSISTPTPIHSYHVHFTSLTNLTLRSKHPKPSTIHIYPFKSSMTPSIQTIITT